MHRRSLLTALGAGLAGVAGCLSESQPTANGTVTNTDTTPDESVTDTGTVTPDGLRLERITVQKAVTYESLLGSGGVLAGDDQQYVVGAIRGVDDATDLEFTFETASDSWSESLPDTAGSRNYSVAGRERPYVAFTVPSPLSATNPRIVGADRGEWEIPESQRETLDASAPRFELDGLTVPDSVSQGEDLSVSLTATNVSETDGRFLAALYWPTNLIADDDESHVLDRSVAAGEQVTATVDIDTEYTAYEAGTFTLDVDGHVEASREVQVTDVSTPT